MNRDNGNAGNPKNVQTQRRWRRWVAAFAGILAIIIVIVLLIRDCAPEQTVSTGISDSTISTARDTVDLIVEDTVKPSVTDSIKDTIIDTVPAVPVKKVIASPVITHIDTVIPIDTGIGAPDDSITLPDTVEARDTVEGDKNACGRDTAELWVYPDPSGGLHYNPVQVLFIANRLATIHYRTGNDTTWHRYEGRAVVVDTSTTLYYDAIDSCGNVMERRSEYYEFDTRRSMSPCHPDMEQIKVGTMNFCIDRYEWPNRKGVKPQSFISLYQAMDSCFSVGKRLCSSDEWAIACSGPYSSKYPYGQLYERYACGTHDTIVRASGSKPECRSFFGTYDMSGNLLEWTSTKSVENGAFYYVMGGFWESGPKSGCFDKRYSYYPQNQHNPVGFRCCRDIPLGSTSPSGIGK